MTKTHEGFWTWFVEHDSLYSVDCDHEAEPETVFDELQFALEKVHAELPVFLSSSSDGQKMISR